MVASWRFGPQTYPRLCTCIVVLLVHSLIGVCIGYYYSCDGCGRRASINNLELTTIGKRTDQLLLEESSKLSSNVHILNLSERTNTTFRCISAKKLLGNVGTTVCLHKPSNDIYVSGSFHERISIWEETEVAHILQLLIRHPHLGFIDIGANIGTYTMYAAALGRFVLAIDCFQPNLDRLRRAIQLENVTDRVVVVQNAIYLHSGQILRLALNTTNIGGQAITTFPNRTARFNEKKRLPKNDPYSVRTIRFDDVLPILTARGVRSALMKIDIEGSESFVFESGSRVFDAVDIPLVQMEWFQIAQNEDRVRLVLDFFNERRYRPVTRGCDLLSQREYKTWPGDVYWLKRNASNFCWSTYGPFMAGLVLSWDYYSKNLRERWVNALLSFKNKEWILPNFTKIYLIHAHEHCHRE